MLDPSKKMFTCPGTHHEGEGEGRAATRQLTSDPDISDDKVGAEMGSESEKDEEEEERAKAQGK